MCLKGSRNDSMQQLVSIRSVEKKLRTASSVSLVALSDRSDSLFTWYLSSTSFFFKDELSVSILSLVLYLFKLKKTEKGFKKKHEWTLSTLKEANYRGPVKSEIKYNLVFLIYEFKGL